MAMAQKYLFIAISFYRNIVRENVSCELGLTLMLSSILFPFSLTLFIFLLIVFVH